MNTPRETLIARVRANLPARLRGLPVWLLHDKAKEPYYVNGEHRHGDMDTPRDRAHFVTFETAAKALMRVSHACGLGVALGEVPGEDIRLCGIDLDHCYQGDDLESRATEILLAASSYAERSLSGAGLHILGIGDIGMYKVPGLELYSGRRYLTVTGNAINGAHLEDIGDSAALARKLFGVVEPRSTPPAPAEPDDPVLAAIKHAGLYLREGKEGKHLIRCPWELLHTPNEAGEQHTSGTEAAYFAPGAKVSGIDEPLTHGHFKCQHAHCGHRKLKDLRDYLALDPPSQPIAGKLIAFPGLDSERIKELAALPAFSYERLRKEEAKKLGVRAKALDEAIKELRVVRGIEFVEAAPWEEPVGGEVLDLVEAEVQRYIVLPPGASVAVTLWITMTWAFDHLYVAPMLLALSPEKRCGKSTLLMLLGELCKRSLLASNLSGAVVFRVIEEHCPSLLIDEADTFAKKDDCLRGVINAGHTKRTAFVLRCAGEELTPRKFSCWAPRALAAIGRLTGTWEDRAVIVRMRRKKTDERVALLRQDRLDLEPIRRRLARWAQDHGAKLPTTELAMPAGFESRLADNWRPLFSIADLAGGAWPERARTAAVTLSATVEDDAPGVQLLADLRELLKGVDRIRSADLVLKLTAMEDRPWPEWGKSRQPITQTQIARLLKPFDIIPGTQRFGPNETAKGYTRDQFEDAWRRYLEPAKEPVK
jgi:putative DNA primase/helicase